MPPPVSLASRRPSRTQVAVGCSAVAVLVQSVGPVIVRKIELAGLAVGFNRCWMGALFTIGLLYLKGERLSWRIIKESALGGLTFALNIATFFVAVKRTSIANASVIAAMQPLFLMLIVNRIFGERPRPAHWVCSAAAMVGVVLVVRGSTNAKTGDPFGDFLAFIAMLLFVAYFLASKRARKTMTTFEYQAGLLIVATVAMLPMALLSGSSIRVNRGVDWFWLSMMVLLPGSGHLLTNYALAHIPLIVPAVLNLFVPAGSTLLAWLLVDERLVAVQVAGVGVVVGSLAVMIATTNPGGTVKPALDST
ncbi:MAG TPA: DMT family transporter [Acidimicrobiales bacterium]|nr:DMT family transporter [Acidimicrobiales bacterium]